MNPSAWAKQRAREMVDASLAERGTKQLRLDIALALDAARRDALEEAAKVCEDDYARWLAEPEIRGSTTRALESYAGMGAKIRALGAKL